MELKPSSLVLSETSTTDRHSIRKLYCATCGAYKEVFFRCGDRTCQICRFRDYLRLMVSYRDFLKTQDRLRLITLTLKINYDDLPASRVVFLRKCFRALIRKPYFKHRIKGGLYVIEAKRINNGWNIHIHILSQGWFVPQDELSSAWLKITGDSYIVDIRDAYSGIGGLKYILKYLTKSPDVGDYRAEYNEAFRGSRLISSFGTWYNRVALKNKKVLICSVCGGTKWIFEGKLGFMSDSARKIEDFDSS